ncbi:hypothetical protein [Halomonas denitrificans]|uniref:hypothetical protein n=1 Tax=Halomonas denitrificans TaxID=370769 RepID=UPI001C990408|nr:hypothetical protein [Halomonas denitrificans]MBY5967267.1 hypothetical protein [Halomonas denitrificans]
MTRGMFENIANNAAYKGASKNWYVELIMSEMVWYDILVNPIDGFDVKDAITKKLREMKRIVEEQCDKRFVYYIAARKKVRFSRKRPYYSFFDKKLVLYLEIGRKRKIKKIRLPIRDIETGGLVKPGVKLTDRVITFEYPSGGTISMTVHDLLSQCNIDLGESTEIHYVGYTNSPWDRPLNRSHRGLSDTLYNVSTEEFDIFIFYNIFKVISLVKNSKYNINFAIANSLIDEVKVDEEGSIIEKALIFYFDTATQELNKKSERGSLKKNMVKMAGLNNISSIGFGLEVEDDSEYFDFCSRKVGAKHRHEFSINLDEGEPKILHGESVYKSKFGEMEGSA